jgi:site-specific DNA-adenine methylase
MGIVQHLTAKAIVANDLNDNAINFYRVASDNILKYELSHKCKRVLSHPREIHDAMEVLAHPVRHSRVDLAVAYWTICWVGRKGSGGSESEGGSVSVRWKADGGNNATRIQAASSDLEEWSNHFSRCEWACQDYRDFIEKVADDSTCAIYCDPPWVEVGNRYKHPFSDDDHKTLRLALERFEKTRVVVRYGDSELVRALYHDWEIIELKTRTQSNKRKPELLLVRN